MRFLLALLVLPAALVVGCSGEDGATAGEEQDQNALSMTCSPVIACPAPGMAPVARRSWRHPIKSRIDIAAGAPHHRGRDLFLNPGAPQTIIGKLGYGSADVDLTDEEVDVFVQRDCGSGWEKLGTAVTTSDPGHPTVEGVEDLTGGRIYFNVPADKRLGAGRHRVRLIVAGDGSSTDLFLDVVPPRTPFFVSDVDGTLTSSENVELVKLLEGELPDTHPGAPEALRALAARGYRPIYITARPEFLVQRTRDFLEARGFPPGLIHTSTSQKGAGFGAAAATFKSGELAMLAKKGLVPAFAFGNQTSDSEAYAGAGIQPQDHRIFFQITGDFSGRRIESYQDLAAGFTALPSACP